MNTEQKAKAYDEALEKAKAAFDMAADKDLVGGVVRTIFPELKESEDERIRVRLIEYFKGFLEGYEDCYKDGGCVKWEGLDVKSILAWLEKQKENANSFTDGVIEVRSFQRGMEEGRKLEKKKLDKMIVVSPEVWDNAISDAYENGKKEGEKQKEQKHPDGCFTCDEYKKGYEEGRRNGFTAGYNKAMKEVEQKEQMLKDAVEGTVMDFSSNRPRPQVDVLLDPHKYHTGDKVRIVILKQKDE